MEQETLASREQSIMLKRVAQFIVASAVLLTAGCAADQTTTASADRQRLEIPIITGVGDFIGSMMHGRDKHRSVQEQPVLDVATTPVQE
jgi:hypothetical protein